MVKKAFTLFELIIVIIIISIVYSFALSNLNFKRSKVDAITLENLKQTMMEFDFKNNIKIKCIDDEKLECLIITDGNIQATRIANLFQQCPEVYEYSAKQERLEFQDVDMGKLEVLPICFEFEVKKGGTTSQLIVDTSQKVYIYDGISSKPFKIDYINDISSYFDDKINEVKDAF